MGNTQPAIRRGPCPRWDYLKYLLYWPVFGAIFGMLERGRTPLYWNVMHCPLDDAIPFCEWFLIPYLFWFVYLAGMHVYTFFYEPEQFKKLMTFIAVSYTLGLAIFMAFPSCQHLRPESFARDNPLTRLTAAFYAFDTNTNVCPSLHVVGSAAVALCGVRCERIASSHGWRAAIVGMAALISVSTLFMKQHSVLDVICAAAVCALAYIPAYGETAMVRKVRRREALAVRPGR